MDTVKHLLRAPETPDDWHQYHTIRRRVLWERRGKFGSYDENHPDEYKVGNYPLLLTCREAVIGVVRIDVDGATATLRRVAIREDIQRSGHGRVLLALAEAFALRHGCNHLYSFVSPDAVDFYSKCGFHRDSARPANSEHVPMEKFLVRPAN